jgi:nitrate/TMAO reductase-like tetraheme cytochrome c subunit
MRFMSQESPESAPVRSSLLRNWMSLIGLVVVIGGLFSFLLLFVLDSVAHFSNPYISILTWMIAPGFLVFGLLLTAVGIFREWHRRAKSASWVAPVQIDLSRPRDRRIMAAFLAGSVTFLLVSAVGSYNTFQFTESVQFCGETCHGVMKPELTTHDHGPHARVACVACHVGPGATWFVRSKLSGSYQVYAVAFNKYPRPITTPIKNLRPARETCEQCHWPQKFTGNLDKTFTYFQSDETNTPYSIRLSVKIGGSDPTHGPVGGIHWHMVVANTVEYIATDAARQKIPWVRITDAQGVVTVYHEPHFTNDPSQYEIRKMDCMDCHNRPSHRYVPPDKAVNLAMELGQIDRTLPWIKTNAIFVLTRNYTNEDEARKSIATLLAERYPDDPRIRPATAAVQQIYADNFFPEMKANWSVYPDNIGHMRWPGCFRCHDGDHKTDDGKRVIDSHDCNSCHTILAQGSGAELNQLTPGGQPFKHPGGDYDINCSNCHDGTL